MPTRSRMEESASRRRPAWASNAKAIFTKSTATSSCFHEDMATHVNATEPERGHSFPQQREQSIGSIFALRWSRFLPLLCEVEERAGARRRSGNKGKLHSTF